jgi:hypothetical protein
MSSNATQLDSWFVVLGVGDSGFRECKTIVELEFRDRNSKLDEVVIYHGCTLGFPDGFGHFRPIAFTGDPGTLPDGKAKTRRRKSGDGVTPKRKLPKPVREDDDGFVLSPTQKLRENARKAMNYMLVGRSCFSGSPL